MLRHTFILAFRNFMRHKSSFFINLIGLSTGLACALLIFLWVHDELQVDKFHQTDSRLFQVMEHQQYADHIMTTKSTPGLLAETLAEEIPEIEYAATIVWTSEYTLTVGQKNLRQTGRFVGEDFFHIFGFDLIRGNKSEVLKDINSITVSQSLANNLFGGVDEAIGQTIALDHDKVYTVSGVFEDVPVQSSLQFDFILPYEGYKQSNEWIENWGNNGPQTMLTLIEGADAEKVSNQIANFVKDRQEESNVTLFLRPFSDLYLYGRYEAGILTGGRIEYVRLFSVIAICILVIACINFMNLSTARASRRAKEVGIKKAVGVERRMLISQYLGESMIIACFSLFLACIVVILFLPHFNLITEKQIALTQLWNLGGVFLGITLFTGILAGSYPALYLSGFKPVAVLKGEIRNSLGELWARRGLVVFQFTLSVVLIVAVIVIYKQIQFVQTKNLGYNKNNLIYFSNEGRLSDHYDAFMTEAQNLPAVSSISSISHNLVGRMNNTSGLDWEGKNPNDRILFENVSINYDLLETIDVELKEGRFFSRAYGADTSKIIFNEKGIEVMGLENPIGKTIKLWDEYDMEIIGVVKNFHFQSLHEEINPLFFRLKPEFAWLSMVRLEQGREEEGIEQLRQYYEQFNPGFNFDFDFVDQAYARQYSAEQLVATLSSYFAGFAILISCMGLLGLAAYTADRKKKEIGIRKVLGATASQIVLFLTKDFTRLVGVSILIGLPVSYFLIQTWLDQFTYKIEMDLLFFVLAGILVLCISWFTVGSQALHAAHINPKDCLRDE